MKTISIILLTILAQALSAQSLVVNISNIRNSEGQMQIAIFENNDQFKHEEPISKQYFKKDRVRDGKMTIRIELEPGTYGISVLDDEDSNTKMTFKAVVYPQEGVGFSNYVLKGMSKPKFEEFDFEIEEQKPTPVEVVIKYF